MGMMLASENRGQSITGNQRAQNFDVNFEPSSADYRIDRQNSIQNNSRIHYLNDGGNAIQGLSALNPLTAIDGVRNPNDSEGRASNIRVDSRQSLSATVNINDEAKENNQAPPSVVLRQTWLAARNSKPPLFRHQMMLRTSEPDYSASQNNSLSPPNGTGL